MLASSRKLLLEHLSNSDNHVAEKYLEALDKNFSQQEMLEALPANFIRNAIRHSTIYQHKTQLIPVLLGSALKNKGITTLDGCYGRLFTKPG